jgi:hypothetical protein
MAKRKSIRSFISNSSRFKWFVAFGIGDDNEKFDRQGREIVDIEVHGFRTYDEARDHALAIVTISESEGASYHVELADKHANLLQFWMSGPNGINRQHPTETSFNRVGICRSLGDSVRHPFETQWLPLPRGSGDE